VSTRTQVIAAIVAGGAAGFALGYYRPQSTMLEALGVGALAGVTVKLIASCC
jgi:hypothetical protein